MHVSDCRAGLQEHHFVHMFDCRAGASLCCQLVRAGDCLGGLHATRQSIRFPKCSRSDDKHGGAAGCRGLAGCQGCQGKVSLPCISRSFQTPLDVVGLLGIKGVKAWFPTLAVAF